jgi:hypothetical protein
MFGKNRLYGIPDENALQVNVLKTEKRVETKGIQMERYQDPNDPLNATSYHTGKKCVERGCDRIAGTHWSKLWCQPCNAARMGRISGFLQHEVARYEGAAHPDSMYKPPKSES